TTIPRTASGEIYTISYTPLFRSVAGPRIDRLHDLRDHALLVQEVLAEMLLGRFGEAAALVVGRHSNRVPGGTSLSGTHSATAPRSEEHTSELQSRENLVCRLLLE